MKLRNIRGNRERGGKEQRRMGTVGEKGIGRGQGELGGKEEAYSTSVQSRVTILGSG